MTAVPWLLNLLVEYFGEKAREYEPVPPRDNCGIGTLRTSQGEQSRGFIESGSGAPPRKVVV